jgi:protein-tyrosine phosphatase
MKDLVEKAGLSSKIHIASAATSTEKIGNSVYLLARKRLAREGIFTDGKYAVQMKKRIMRTMMLSLAWTTGT